MVWFKDCPRCKGDVFLDQDNCGWYKQCIQCGYVRDITDKVEISQCREERRDKLSRRSEYAPNSGGRG